MKKKKIALNHNESNPDLSNTRLTLALGLLAVYVGVLAVLPFNPFLISYKENFGLLLQKLLLMGWGVNTVFLLVYIFLYALEIKFVEKNSFRIMGYDLQIPDRLYRICFDVAVEGYISGILINVIYAIPFIAINRGAKPLPTIIGFILFVIILSYLLLRLEKLQKLKTE